MSVIMVCEIEIELLTQTFRTETCFQRCPETFINKIAYHYIILISKEGVK